MLSCNKCIYFNKGRCKKFKYISPHKDVGDLLIKADVCRKNDFMCGTKGIYFKKINVFNLIYLKLYELIK